MEAAEIKIRLLGEADLPAAMRLKEAAGWNQTEADWLRLLRLEPRGCFAATAEGGRLVGTATTTSYGRELAWIGMVLVDPEFRRRGIASRLMSAALEYLDGEGIAAVKLDATPDGRTVYKKLGFEVELIVERWSGSRSGAAGGEHPGGEDSMDCSVLDVARLAEILELDRGAFGADRARLIEALVTDGRLSPIVRSTSEGSAGGYALVRAGSMADYIGPLVASDFETAALLLDDVLVRLSGRPLYIDMNTRFVSAARALAGRGFRKQRELIRMRRGAKTGAGTSDKVFAIAGPEVG